MRRTPPAPCLFSVALALGLALACSDDGDTGERGGADADSGLREVGDTDGRDLPATGDVAGDTDAGTSGDVPVSDAPAPDGAGDAADPDVAPGPGPENPVVGCVTNADCPDDGDDPGACCTNPNTYTSECATESRCTGGARDACLTDAQCAARRPGEWTVCCHDRGDRSYCAPLVDTCQPLRPCDDFADCAGDAVDTCCSRHPYYQAGYCTSEFFAANPATDCPP